MGILNANTHLQKWMWIRTYIVIEYDALWYDLHIVLGYNARLS